MDFVLSIPYLPYILLAALVFFGYQTLASRVKMRAPGVGFSLDDLIAKLLGPGYAESKVRKAVAKMKKEGQYLGAGKLWEDHGRLPEAAEAYIEGEEYFAAAVVFEKMGRGERAAELYLQAGDYKKSAQVLIDAGKPGRAAALFLEKGNTLEAARLYGVAGQWDKAGDLYAKAGYPLRAAEAYEKKGEFHKAAECYEKHFMENVSYATTYSSTAASADQKSALLAGRLYEKAGELPRAAEVYQKGSYFKEAAAACLSIGQFPKAAELYLRAEDPENAALAWERAGDHVRAANLRGEVALKADRVPEAAAFFQKGADYLRAAELFESVGMLAEAAGAYEAGESFTAAGGVYIRAGLKDRAAASYERGGEFETAAKLYEEIGNGRKAAELYAKAGLTFKSGEAAAKAGEREKGIALLQRVGPSDESYRQATELLARLFIEARMPGLAVERLQKALAGQPVSPGSLDLYYWLAAAHEASGNTPEGLSIYKKILSEDLSYKDVEKRVARLQAGAPPLPPPGGPPAHPAPPPAAPQNPVVAAARAPAPPAAAAPASRAQRFVPKEEVGRGPLGVVFRAEDQVDGRSVALRMLSDDLLKPDILATLGADLKAAAQVSHPNLVKVLGLIDVGGKRAIVTELVQGKNFAEALKAGRKMSFQQGHTLGRILAQVLAFLHGKGLVHGSIQPSNLIVAAGVIKVADLGLGRVSHSRAGALGYHAPENALDVAGDLYAAAAVMYHLLTGVHPRSQPQGAALPLPSTLAPGVPEALDKLLLRCLHPRKELRFAAAEDVLRELKDMVKIG